MNELRDEQMRLLNTILDGEATLEQREHARDLAEHDPGFARAMNQMLAAEARLRALYQPSEIRSPSLAMPTARFGWSRTLAYAAIIALACIIGLFAFRTSDPRRANADALHQGFVRNPAPTTICDTPDKFLAYTRENLGEPIIADFGPGVQFVGWRHAGSGYDTNSRTRLLMAYGPANQPIVVLFQPRRLGKPKLQDSRMSMHYERLGQIEAWEISAATKPVVLPRLRLEPDR